MDAVLLGCFEHWGRFTVARHEQDIAIGHSFAKLHGGLYYVRITKHDIDYAISMAVPDAIPSAAFALDAGTAA